MNNIFKSYKEDFIKKHLTRNYLPQKENDDLNKKYYKSETNQKEIDEKYKFERESDAGVDKLNFYTEETDEITDTEFNQYINMKVIDRLTEMDNKINTIKGILVFWLILTICGIFVAVYNIIKLASILG